MKKANRLLSVLSAFIFLFFIPSGLAENALDGEWAPYGEIKAAVLTEESKEAFESAMKSYNGLPMEPAVLLATQLVSGTNYACLAKVKNLPKNAASGWYVVVVYEDLEGNTKVTSAVEINPADLKTAESVEDPGFVGAWVPAGTANAITLPEEAWGPFWRASESYTDVIFNPLALIATQVVAGINYLIVCQGTVMTEEPADALYFVTMYVDPEGNAEFVDAQPMDMAAYNP